ncbi:MAG: PilC/PilY family type IV pilus protein, partial [Gammaproteobacteria bacterium]|nr:PilC/PilY family type IV pilus protein [Gammaproteobacteria bacterium]
RDATAEDGLGSYVSPFLIECQQAYIILVTDGAHAVTDFDGDANSKLALLTANPADTGRDIDTNFGDSPLDELAEYMYDNDLYSGLDGIQRAVTYTVGIGIAGGSLEETLLMDTADKGNGIYTNGNETSSIVTAIRNVIVSIHSATSSFSAPTLSVNAFNKLFNRDEVYFALFSPSTTTRWNGNVKKFQLCDQDQDAANVCEFGEIIDVNNNPIIDPVTLRIKNDAVSYWDTIQDGGDVTSGGAGGQIPDASVRNYYSVIGDYTTMTFPVALSSFPVTATSGDNFHDTAVADPTLLGMLPAATSTEVVQQIDWLLGVDVFDEDDDGDSTEQRWAFADPLHARPVAVTFGFEPDGLGDSDPDKPVIKLFAATNDGVVRMINDLNGQEEWAFMPQELLGNQYALAQNAEGSHIYGMDGTPQFWVNDINGDGIIDPSYTDPITGDPEHMYMYISMRRGGRNIYAFDVTPTDAQNQAGDRARTDQFAPKLLWVIRGGVDAGFEDLGFTWSNPQVTDIRVKCNSCTFAGDSESSAVLIFGGGYDTNQDTTINDPNGNGPDTKGNGLYIVDPTTGDKIVSIGGTAATGTYDLVVPDMEFSIPTDLALLDSNADGETDRLYFGDTGGQVWRVDLGDQLDKVSGNQTGGTAVGKLADVSCAAGTRVACNSTAVQDRRKFLHAPDVAQVRDNNFSVTAEYDIVTIVSGDRADPLDQQTEGVATPATPVEAVHQRLYVFRDYLVADTVNGTNYPQCVSGGSLSTCAAPLDESDLFDATDNVLQDETSASFPTAVAALIDSTGWYIDLEEDTAITTPAGNSTWIGEKGLARPVIFDETIFATTYVPANDQTALQTCTAREGLGRLYGLNLLKATAMVDFDESGGDPTDADRSIDLGGGIPSELVVVIREGGVTGLVGVSGGTAAPPLDSELPRFTTFWYMD